MEDIVPLLMAILILALMLGLVMFVSHVQPVKVLVVSAARNCARNGVETLAEGRGLDQALTTAVETAAAGSAIDPAGLQVRAYTEDVWGRGRVFVCETRYNVRVDLIPMVHVFYDQESLPITSRASLAIEPYKSRWGE